MTAQSASEAKDLIILAERMGIPVDEAMRQVAHLVADVELPAERALREPVATAAGAALA
jgi:hypothetical protein